VPEVARLATTMVLLSDGKVTAAGSAPAIMARLDLRPIAGRYEAGAIIEAKVLGEDTEYALTRLGSAAGELRVPRLDLPVGSTLRVRIRARDVMIADRPPEGLSALNVLEGRISEIGPQDGPIVELGLEVGGERLRARVTRQSVDRLQLAPGRRVYAVIKSIAFDRGSLGARAAGPDSSLEESEEV
jgi:molybdate transport system ATP-binding protein